MPDDVLISKSALDSVSAFLSDKRDGEKENAYDSALKNCMFIPDGHLQADPPENVTEGFVRLYTVTTIARSPVYGGIRTPIICNSFEFAKRVVEENMGNIWEYSYMFAVIEAIVPNWIYSASYLSEQYWYVWDHDKESYQPISAPSIYSNTTGWAIG